MTVAEFIEWLKQFPDQGSTVEVLHCGPGTAYTQQGGVTYSETFDPEKHVEYTDFRGNPWVKEDAPYYNKRTLLLGLNNG